MTAKAEEEVKVVANSNQLHGAVIQLKSVQHVRASIHLLHHPDAITTCEWAPLICS